MIYVLSFCSLLHWELFVIVICQNRSYFWIIVNEDLICCFLIESNSIANDVKFTWHYIVSACLFFCRTFEQLLYHAEIYDNIKACIILLWRWQIKWWYNMYFVFTFVYMNILMIYIYISFNVFSSSNAVGSTV